MPSGIFKPAFAVVLPTTVDQKASAPASHPLLVSQDSHIFIDETSLQISKVGQKSLTLPKASADWIVNVTLSVRSSVAAQAPTISISIPSLKLDLRPVRVGKPIPADTTSSTFISAAFRIPDGVPERWFPHNLGTPKLYNITTTLHLDNGHSVAFVTQTGFRTITLIQSPVPQNDVEQRGITPGDQWHFEINGKAFYSSGTNIIPFDPFYARMTSAQVRWVLESAVMSGQNMVSYPHDKRAVCENAHDSDFVQLRIWGGGIYQPSDELTGGYDFYTACDELGILAWSELIFSDSLYPINDFLLDSVDPEVRQNVRRINKHPSNVQWAGGNEIEGIVIMVNQTVANGTHYLDEVSPYPPSLASASDLEY